MVLARFLKLYAEVFANEPVVNLSLELFNSKLMLNMSKNTLNCSGEDFKFKRSNSFEFSFKLYPALGLSSGNT